MRLVVGHRREQAGLAQPGRERLRGLVGLGRRHHPVEPAHVVDDVHLARVVGAEPGDVEGRVHQLAVPEVFLPPSYLIPQTWPVDQSP